MHEPASRRGKKRLDPDPRTRTEILAVAATIIREEGVRQLNIAQVLSRAELSTRAFYRHFNSKDQLVAAVFLGMARAERARLEHKMAASSTPVEAVAAWIDGRLDLAFNDAIKSDLRQMSLEAQSQMFAAPQLISPAYDEILKPLVEQLEKGKRMGVFPDIDPESAALPVQGAVWSSVEKQWSSGNCDRRVLRERTQRFCLRGLGVTARAVDDVLSRGDFPDESD